MEICNGGKEIGLAKDGFFLNEYKKDYLGGLRLVFWQEFICSKDGEINIIDKVGTLYEYHMEFGIILNF